MKNYCAYSNNTDINNGLNSREFCIIELWFNQCCVLLHCTECYYFPKHPKCLKQMNIVQKYHQQVTCNFGQNYSDTVYDFKQIVRNIAVVR